MSKAERSVILNRVGCYACPKKDEEIAKLRAENKRLDYLHKLDHSLADQWQYKNEQLRKELSKYDDLECPSCGAKFHKLKALEEK